jgi:hypothetical protein
LVSWPSLKVVQPFLTKKFPDAWYTDHFGEKDVYDQVNVIGEDVDIISDAEAAIDEKVNRKTRLLQDGKHHLRPWRDGRGHGRLCPVRVLSCLAGVKHGPDRCTEERLSDPGSKMKRLLSSLTFFQNDAKWLK